MINNIVIFGSDNSGKSSLTSQLVKLFNSRGQNCDGIHSPGPTALTELKNFMEENLSEKGSNKITVFDRFPIIEESVYGTILRGSSKFTDESYNKKILDQVDLFIFCYPGLSSILNWGDREQMDGVKEHAIEIINKYNMLAQDLIKKGYKVKEYNYHYNNCEEIIDD